MEDNRQIHIDAEGKSSVKLFVHTDTVLKQPLNISHKEMLDVTNNWPDILKNILVISIDQKRLNTLYKRVGPLAKYFTLINSVNGRNLTNVPESFTRGAFGCYKSHRNAWEYIVKHNLPFGFILEDDCEITPNKETLMILKLALKQCSKFSWDVLFVGRNPAFCRTRKKLAPNIVQVGKTWGLFAYVLTFKAATELVEASKFGISQPVDVFVSTTSKAARLKLGITPIPFITQYTSSDTINIT